jgi:hypothetical protein
MDTKALSEILVQLHENSVWTLNRVKALEVALVNKHPELWNEYRDALRVVQNQADDGDFRSKLDKAL